MYMFSFPLAAQVEEGMSSGGSSGFPSTPAPATTPFIQHVAGGVRPEDLAAGISREEELWRREVSMRLLPFRTLPRVHGVVGHGAWVGLIQEIVSAGIGFPRRKYT